MASTHSPLRYPGGKSCLYEVVRLTLRGNKLERGHYAEPYAGGGSLALALLYGGHASDIHLNDLDLSVWSFWDAVLNETDALIDRIERTSVTVDEWLKQREVQRDPENAGRLDLAFATFFLNRTNRSGIIKNAGVIGGLEQTGNYKIDCRYNKQELIRRIRRVSRYKGRIHLYRMDALKFFDYVENELPEDTFCCIDPPYFNKGSSLYTSFYDPQDHANVAERVLKLTCPWLITYDESDEIRKLYASRRQYEFNVKYSVQTKRIGSELMIASKGLRMPEEIRSRQVHRPQYRAA
ncbi:DNA adenine methylase [Glycocaulis profundi]|nr:DNA adenine methylase [Glycocaulis profundi]